MAADIEDVTLFSERLWKRKRSSNRPKLLRDHRVEVRSVEEGFQGSWHRGTVIACENQIRKVRYDHLLCDDNSDKLVESVQVSFMVDGKVPAMWRPSTYRGSIRPLPPRLKVDKWCLHFGQCVDVFHEDAWWEGVIFDHDDGSEERLIFFPDLGDEMRAQILMLRITQDWDEASEDWKPRGNWIFLELIEEVEQEWPLLVSVKQIWYEVRIKKGFDYIKEWTCSLRDIWKDLVMGVISDNFKLTMKEFFHKLNSSGDLEQNGLPFLELNELAFDATVNPKASFSDSLAVLPINVNNQTSILSVEEESDPDDDLGPPGFSNLPSDPDGLLGIASYNDGSHEFEVFSTVSKLPSCGLLTHSKERKHFEWLPAGHDLVPMFCPDAITEYYKQFESGSRPSSALTLKVRQHLSYLGWKIEFKKDYPKKDLRYSLRFRYTDPTGKYYFSLNELCWDLSSKNSSEFFLMAQDDQRCLGVPSSYLAIEKRQEQSKASLNQPSVSDLVVIEGEYSPQAVLDYYSLKLEDGADLRRLRGDARVKEMQIKAKKHLFAVGWSVFYTDTLDSKGRRQLRYRSPNGKLFYNLRSACKHHICYGEASAIKVSGKSEGELGIEGLSSPLTQCSGSSVSRELVKIGKVKERGIRKLRFKRKNGVFLCLESDWVQREVPNLSSQLEKQGKKGGLCGDSSARVMRSRKRARQVASNSSLHQTPRTVLSWLIENNVVLPRAKVQYRCRKDGSTMAEGRVTRDGIKCSCCQDTFSLSKFEIHAGSTYHRPSANIFLEDGRSLLDCQLQLKRDNNSRVSRTEPRQAKGSRHQLKNDYICSVCHVGGELVLCDRCPSSFHTHCLGMKEVPDGDWFCPSCCCRICGQSSRYSDHSEQSADSSILNCEQCERRYHVGCLKEKGLAKPESYPGGNWFCSIRCEEIFMGLHRLLGKPVPAGSNNLTWTLLKHKKSDCSNNDVSDLEEVMENYSKLNIALSVMHECFEPVKEPRTRRDLVEDVIFCRRSELNRLNFRGFYTVLLERDDELISVATVRVYGEKVAEVPLVGTRFQYRRLGMCRILMNVLEKKLVELGVERLVLPAVPSVLNTWTTSFGFSVMTESERLNFLDYTFLDFQGTFMCQKLLIKGPSTESTISRGTRLEPGDGIDGNESIDLDRVSSVSEVFQAEQIEESGIVDQGSLGIARVDVIEKGSVAGHLQIVVNKQTLIECQSEISVGCSMEASDHKEDENGGNNGLLKCYQRRRIAACGS